MHRVPFSLIMLITFFISDAVAMHNENTPGITDPWRINGSNTLRYDYYANTGDQTASPYRFSNSQYYDEFNLNLKRQITPYNKLTGTINGLLNSSRYRSSYPGAVAERINIKQENGDAALSYRAEAGDLFAFQSYRTIQRSLKGVQLEFQPRLGTNSQNSIVLFSGSASSSWRDISSKDGWSSGISWLTQSNNWGRFAANILNNRKESDGITLLSSTSQTIYSLAYENTPVLLNQQLTIEAEIGLFKGDHADLNGVGSGKNQRGNAIFTQIAGSPVSIPELAYRFRYENYDQDYLPDTASIQADRLSREGHLSWRFTNGLVARGRLQFFRNNKQTTNPLDTDVYGINISGPFQLGLQNPLSGSIDAFKQETRDRNLTTNTLTRVVNTRLSKNLSKVISANAGFFYSNTNNRAGAPGSPSITRQYSAGLNFLIRTQGISGSISPGFVARSLNTSATSKTNWEYNPSLIINASRGHHSLSLSAAILDQNRPQTTLGLQTQTAGVNYRYIKKDYTIGLEGNTYKRRPDNIASQDTDAWHLGAYITINLDKPAQLSPDKKTSTSIASTKTKTARSSRMALDITQLDPGMDNARLRQITTENGLGTPTQQAGLLIWFNQIFRNIDQPQRLVTELTGDSLQRSAIIIDFDDTGNPVSTEEIFNRIRKQLLTKYGSPDSFFEQGEFSTNMTIELATGRFIRVMEWDTTQGRLRFGIPRRMDGMIRMELQFSSNFPPIRDSLWSMEDIQ